MSRLYTIGLELLINQVIVDKLAGATKIKIKEGKKKLKIAAMLGILVVLMHGGFQSEGKQASLFSEIVYCSSWWGVVVCSLS
jgi:hypothetical protein